MTPRTYSLLAVLAFVLFTVTTCAGCGALVRQATRSRTVGDQNQATVRLEVRCGTMIQGGSGVLLGRFEVLTAAHVVDCDTTPVIIATQLGDFGHNMKVVLEAPGADLARLEIVDDSEFWRSTVAEVADVEVHDLVCVATGRPAYEFHCGVVERRLDTPGHDLALSVPVERGNSGAAVYDVKGRLVGIVTRMRQMKYNGQSIGALATAIGPREWALDAISTVTP